MDTIGNMLSKIKNAYAVGKPMVETPYSKVSLVIAELLEKNGYVLKVRCFKEAKSTNKKIAIDLRYDELGKPSISSIKRISKPGQRVYRSARDLHDLHQGLGLSLVSTSKGIMTSREARVRDLGGEVLCELW